MVCRFHGEAKSWTRLSDFSLSQLPSGVRAAVWAGCWQTRARPTSRSSVLCGSCEYLPLDRACSSELLCDACLWDQPLELGWQLDSLTPPELFPQCGPCPRHQADAISSSPLPHPPEPPRWCGFPVPLPRAPIITRLLSHPPFVGLEAGGPSEGSLFTQVDARCSCILFVSLPSLDKDRFAIW